MSKTRFYRHYKNKPYKYLGTARHSETLEDFVLYEALYENAQGRVWIRPKEMFFEKINKDGNEIFRFEPVFFDYKEHLNIGPAEIKAILSIGKSCISDFDEVKLNQKLKEQKDVYLILASDGEKPVGFKLGFKMDPTIFNSWLGGVATQYHGLGIASALMTRQHHWVRENGFKKIITKSKNKFRKMINLNLKNGFEINGTEAEPSGEITILFQKSVDV